MDRPVIIVKNNFQEAWLDVVHLLLKQHWNAYNLIIQITNTDIIDNQLHQNYSAFCETIRIKAPKSVAYTIFPHKLHRIFNNRHIFFNKYINIVIPKLRRLKHFGWGTYFQRMVDYNNDGQVNQLENIINAINSRRRYSKAAYTILIQKPGGETIRPLGGPCLNYIAVQISTKVDHSMELSLMCIYRNHDFLERAYGNYWGLLNLLKFLAHETNLNVGVLTCISSHAYVDKKKTELKNFLEAYRDNS